MNKLRVLLFMSIALCVFLTGKAYSGILDVIKGLESIDDEMQEMYVSEHIFLVSENSNRKSDIYAFYFSCKPIKSSITRNDINYSFGLVKRRSVTNYIYLGSKNLQESNKYHMTIDNEPYQLAIDFGFNPASKSHIYSSDPKAAETFLEQLTSDGELYVSKGFFDKKPGYVLRPRNFRTSFEAFSSECAEQGLALAEQEKAVLALQKKQAEEERRKHELAEELKKRNALLASQKKAEDEKRKAEKNEEYKSPYDAEFKYVPSSNGVNALTTYAVVLGRATGCDIDVSWQAARVGRWIDNKFQENREAMLNVLMSGMTSEAQKQARGVSPDSCAQVRRTLNSFNWP